VSARCASSMSSRLHPAWRPTRRVLALLVITFPLIVLMSAPALAAQPTLKYGSSGPAVVTLQQRLVALHYDVGPVDGSFGYSTMHAVVAFQKVNGLSRDGVVGPATWYALAHPRVPKPRYWRSSSSIEVDLTRQVVYLARAGSILRILDASTGSGQWYYQGGTCHRAVTPTGNFRIQAAHRRLAREPVGLDVPTELLLRRVRDPRVDLGASLPG
jgi:hypothetical protein